MNHILENEAISLTISSLGAELCSAVNKATGFEYIFNADPAYWKRHAPVLFPIVGSLKNGAFTHEGKTYPMSQHGFARDREFTTIDTALLPQKVRSVLTDAMEAFVDAKALTFVLTSDEQTLAAYPFEFKLFISYILSHKNLTVLWSVYNSGSETMHFSIGAHPAFYYPKNADGSSIPCKISFDGCNQFTQMLLTEKGLANRSSAVKLSMSELPIEAHTFDQDALILTPDLPTGTEGTAKHYSISLVNAITDKKVVSITSHAPIFGLWSPAKKSAPFVCIEPWWGRADADDFAAALADREYGNHCALGEVFARSYLIAFDPE